MNANFLTKLGWIYFALALIFILVAKAEHMGFAFFAAALTIAAIGQAIEKKEDN